MSPRVRKIIRTGNSLAITIPSALTRDFDLHEGDLTQYRFSRSRSSITFYFSGHPRQLSFLRPRL